MLKCISLGCKSEPDNRGFKVYHKGTCIGMICNRCVGDAPGLRLMLLKNKKTGEFELKEAVTMEQPFV